MWMSTYEILELDRHSRETQFNIWIKDCVACHNLALFFCIVLRNTGIKLQAAIVFVLEKVNLWNLLKRFQPVCKKIIATVLDKIKPK